MSDVSVVVTNHNLGAYLPEAVESAWRERTRVIVVDDGSTEPGTDAVLDALPADVTVIRQENEGVAAARNRGIAAVDTDFVLVLDGDDRLAPGAVADLRAALEAETHLGYAYGSMAFFGAWSGVLRMPPFDPYRLLYRHTIGLSALARRAVFDDTGGFDPAFAGYEDWELWVNALAHGWTGRQVERVALEYRRHPGGSKLGRDRRRYRRTWRQLRRKHAALYARRRELARESSLGRADRMVHRAVWGPRPIPARLEAAVQRRLFAAGG